MRLLLPLLCVGCLNTPELEFTDPEGTDAGDAAPEVDAGDRGVDESAASVDADVGRAEDAGDAGEVRDAAPDAPDAAPPEPADEVCNGVDDDLDTQVDEGDLCEGEGVSGVCQASACAQWACDRGFQSRDGPPEGGCEIDCTREVPNRRLAEGVERFDMLLVGEGAAFALQRTGQLPRVQVHAYEALHAPSYSTEIPVQGGLATLRLAVAGGGLWVTGNALDGSGIKVAFAEPEEDVEVFELPGTPRSAPSIASTGNGRVFVVYVIATEAGEALQVVEVWPTGRMEVAVTGATPAAVAQGQPSLLIAGRIVVVQALRAPNEVTLRAMEIDPAIRTSVGEDAMAIDEAPARPISLVQRDTRLMASWLGSSGRVYVGAVDAAVPGAPVVHPASTVEGPFVNAQLAPAPSGVELITVSATNHLELRYAADEQRVSTPVPLADGILRARADRLRCGLTNCFSLVAALTRDAELLLLDNACDPP